MNEQTVKKLALIIAANCSRHSVIEESCSKGQISQEQLSTFNKQMSDKIYTFLTYLLNRPADEYSVMLEELSKNYPESWALPELDYSFTKGMNQSLASNQPPSITH